MDSLPTIIVHLNQELTAVGIANRLITHLVERQSVTHPLHVSLTGGGLGTAIWPLIAAHPLAPGVDWTGVHFWFSDERFVADSDPDRNDLAVLAQAPVLGIPEDNIHRVLGPDHVSDVRAAADHYAHSLREWADTQHINDETQDASNESPDTSNESQDLSHESHHPRHGTWDTNPATARTTRDTRDTTRGTRDTTHETRDTHRTTWDTTHDTRDTHQATWDPTQQTQDNTLHLRDATHETPDNSRLIRDRQTPHPDVPEHDTVHPTTQNRDTRHADARNSDTDHIDTRHSDTPYSSTVNLANPTPIPSPWFEVSLLGIGPDGHVASLFPGSTQVSIDTPGVVPVTDSPKPPAQRVSFTRPLLARCDQLWMLATGTGKAQAVNRALWGDDPARTPAAGLRGRNRTLWFIDSDLARSLT